MVMITFAVQTKKTRIHHQHLISGRGTPGTALQIYKQKLCKPNIFSKKFSQMKEWVVIMRLIPMMKTRQLYTINLI